MPPTIGWTGNAISTSMGPRVQNLTDGNGDRPKVRFSPQARGRRVPLVSVCSAVFILYLHLGALPAARWAAGALLMSAPGTFLTSVSAERRYPGDRFVLGHSRPGPDIEIWRSPGDICRHDEAS